MLRPCVGALVALAALAAPGVASAQIDGDTLDLFADAQGRFQIIPTGESAGVFFPPTSGAPNAGIEAVIGGTPVPLGVGRSTISGPTPTQLPFNAQALNSSYTITAGSNQIQVDEQLGYVTGAPVVSAIYTITNLSPTEVNVRLGAIAHLSFPGNGLAVGQLTGAPPTRQLYANNPATGRKIALFEDTAWSAFEEGSFDDVFAGFQFTTLDNTVDPNPVDAGLGAQWDLGTMAPSQQSQISFGWYVERGVAPTPDLGKSVVAFTSKGKVRVKVPGSNRFVDLDSLRELPLGTVFDTTKGQVTLTSAADAKGTTQKAWFYEGLFKIGQTGGAKPVTTLALAGDKPACAKPQRAKARKGAASKKKAKSRRLWGDGAGRFQTKGQFSSATVRGTKWLVQDRCDGTLTKVVKGSVTVRDFAKRKSVIVKAGDTYLAKAR